MSSALEKHGALKAYTKLMLHLLIPSALCILKQIFSLVQIPNPTSDILIVIFKCIIVPKAFSLKKNTTAQPPPTLPGSHQPSHSKCSSRIGGWNTSVQNTALREVCP